MIIIERYTVDIKALSAFHLNVFAPKSFDRKALRVLVNVSGDDVERDKIDCTATLSPRLNIEFLAAVVGRYSCEFVIHDQRMLFDPQSTKLIYLRAEPAA